MAVTYSALVGAKSTVGSIASWVNHADVPATDILTEAQAWIYARLRHWRMITEATWTAAIGASVLALPTGFLEPITLSIDGSYPLPDGLPYRHEALFPRYRNDDGDLAEGTPSMWTIMDEQVKFDVELDEALAGDWLYYKTPTALSTGNESNFVCTAFPTLLRRTCTMFGYEYRKDFEAREKQEVLALMSLDEANRSADGVRRGQEL